MTPIKYAKILPATIARVLKTNALIGPNSMTPTIVVMEPGRGNIQTCKNCKTTKTEYDHIPADWIISFNSFTFLNVPIHPVYFNKKYTPIKNIEVKKNIKDVFKNIIELLFLFVADIFYFMSHFVF